MTHQDSINVRQVKPQQELVFDFDTLIKDTAKLRNLVMYETKMLREMKVEAVKEIHEEKLNLIRRLELQKKIIARDPSVLTSRTPEDIERLRQLSDGMESILKANFVEVLKAKEVNQRVLKAVGKATHQNQCQTVGYSNRGTSKPSIMGYDQNRFNAPAMSLNQTV